MKVFLYTGEIQVCPLCTCPVFICSREGIVRCGCEPCEFQKRAALIVRRQGRLEAVAVLRKEEV